MDAPINAEVGIEEECGTCHKAILSDQHRVRTADKVAHHLWGEECDDGLEHS